MSDLTIRFPADVAYEGERKEAGYNGLYMFHTAHSWVSGSICKAAADQLLSAASLKAAPYALSICGAVTTYTRQATCTHTATHND